MLAGSRGAWFTIVAFAAIARAGMPAARENALVHKYCAGCHSDKLRYGLMTLEHFDAGHADPSLAAMLLMKITHGRTSKDVLASDAKTVRAMMQGSAMAAAGIKTPDDATQAALARALAQQAQTAFDWNVFEENRAVVASILRGAPSSQVAGAIDAYRLTVSCDEETGAGEIKISWGDPGSKDGTPIRFSVDGVEMSQMVDPASGQGNMGVGATVLKISLPERTLRVSNIVGKGEVEFPLGSLNPPARRRLASCFAHTASEH